ncbi:MAG TPA: hypothetical protein VKX17_14510 [Planctomycetota bacterium]|nr:hypothetical protein [Planctomycetota bacterium]
MKWMTPERRLLLIGLGALALSLIAQRYVEARRVEAKLVWTDPENKGTLEAGFTALGGFRGILADVLWVRAIAQQDAGHYYELQLICDMIQKLQPTFTNVHAFQAHNMAYNLAANAATCEDKWYWIKSGIKVLEQGLTRNSNHYSLWFELGLVYMDRLGDQMVDRSSGMDCSSLRDNELPKLDDLSEAQRAKVFSDEESWKGKAQRARKDEYLRYAAYYFYKALEMQKGATQLRVERVYGNCIDRLGHYRSKPGVAPEDRKWDEWGSEDWWVEMIRRNNERGVPNELTAPQNLYQTMLKEIGLHDSQLQAAMTAHENDKAALLQLEIFDDYKRFKKYFPNDMRTLDQLVGVYREAMRKNNPRFRR